MIIVAPHPDDELIGCFTMLEASEVSEVWYIFDHGVDNRHRMSEAIRCAATFGFKPVFLDGIQDLLEYTEQSGPRKRLVVPSIHDSHPQHKLCNQICRKYAAKFYSVDLEYADSKAVLTPEAQALKKAYLDGIYSTQKELWTSNASYFLFENIVSKDYHILTVGYYWLETTSRGFLQHAVSSNVHLGSLAMENKHYTPEELADALISAGASRFSFNVDEGDYLL